MRCLRDFLTLLLGALVTIEVEAQIDISQYADVKTTVIVDKAGRLSKELNKVRFDLENLTALVVEGNINGTDVKFINDLIALEYLDLSKACIIPGGKSYAEVNQTIDKDHSKKIKYKIEEQDVVSDYMFYRLKNLLVLMLPSNTKEVKKYAFSPRKYFDVYFTNKLLPKIESIDCFRYCNRIIVPHADYVQYYALSKDQSYHEKILMDYAPDSYDIDLSNELGIDSYLSGAYPYVKHLKIFGDISDENMELIKKCSNLESIDLSHATIQDVMNLKQWGVKLGSQVSKSYDLLQLEMSQNKLFQVIEQLEMEKKKVLAKIKEHEDQEEKRAEQRFQYEFLSAILGLADKELERDYENNRMSTKEYIPNRIFQDLLGEELKKELKNLDVSEKPQNLEDVLSLLNRKLSEILEEYSSNKEELETLTAEYEKMQRKESMKILMMSSIPADFFPSFKKIKSIILPDNTVVISEKALPGNAMIKMNKENIKISNNIYY